MTTEKQSNMVEYSALDAPSSHLKEGVSDQRPNGPTARRTDGHILLYRCDGASKNGNVATQTGRFERRHKTTIQ